MTAAAHGPAARDATARIGPNAILRVAEALRRAGGVAVERRVFAAARLGFYVGAPPEHMVDEAEVARLHHALRVTLGEADACAISIDAGRATGRYLLANRIPKPVQTLLRLMPSHLAARVLLQAISRHAWTFAGSGAFIAAPGRPVRFAIRNNPICRGMLANAPACDYYAATFECLFRELVDRRANVVELECEAMGADACRFEIRW
jgi:divinyl protochlorophyllide a 8-vinyl-reductase